MLGQRVKITVLKTLYLADELGLIKDMASGMINGEASVAEDSDVSGGANGPADGSPSPAGPGAALPVPPCPCHIFREGQEIYYQLGGDGVPGGFCDWAWHDIFKDIMAVCSRAAMVPEDERTNVPPAITCCTDGIRPVIFKIEACE